MPAIIRSSVSACE
jgi:hypothetical protein